MISSESGESFDIPDIIVAAYAGDLKVVSDLLGLGADPNTVDPDDNLTILHIACLQGDELLVDLLLNHDRIHGDVDFTAQSRFRPRLAWQFAANGNFLKLSEKVHVAGQAKSIPSGPQITPS